MWLCRLLCLISPGGKEKVSRVALYYGGGLDVYDDVGMCLQSGIALKAGDFGEGFLGLGCSLLLFET